MANKDSVIDEVKRCLGDQMDRLFDAQATLEGAISLIEEISGAAGANGRSIHDIEKVRRLVARASRDVDESLDALSPYL
jgi:hypothetical protein